MGGGPGRLPWGRAVFHLRFIVCLYSRRDGTFFISGLESVYIVGVTGRFSSHV